MPYSGIIVNACSELSLYRLRKTLTESVYTLKNGNVVVNKKSIKRISLLSLEAFWPIYLYLSTYIESFDSAAKKKMVVGDVIGNRAK